MPNTETRIAVLMGGFSEEREVSLVTGRECAAALREAGFRHVVEMDVTRSIASDLAKAGVEVCFNALHGPLGEDGSIQGLMNLLAIPYTHSGVLASSIAMQKDIAKEIAASVGIRCPAGSRMDRAAYAVARFDKPYVIKPINEGSSVHTYVVLDPSKAPFAIEAWPYREPALVEEYISGKELTVTVLDGAALTVTEIVSQDLFYDYEAKYAPGGSRHIIPAEIPAAVSAQCLAWAEAIHRKVGCRGISRSDFIYDANRGEKGVYFLEINTQPGMTPTSLAPEQARHCGIPFPELVSRLIAAAATDK